MSFAVAGEAKWHLKRSIHRYIAHRYLETATFHLPSTHPIKLDPFFRFNENRADDWTKEGDYVL